jgi:hypothetical protein
MSATRENLSQADGAMDDGVGAIRPRRAAATGRWLAVLVALVVVAVLALGSLADALGAALPQQTTQGALTQQVGRSTVSLTIIIAPQTANQTEALEALVVDASGDAVVGARMQCALSMPAMGMALPPITATPMGQPGRYRCAAHALPSGAWSLALTLSLPLGETDHATFDFVVA